MYSLCRESGSIGRPAELLSLDDILENSGWDWQDELDDLYCYENHDFYYSDNDNDFEDWTGYSD
jgi:hypothetical protein